MKHSNRIFLLIVIPSAILSIILLGWLLLSHETRTLFILKREAVRVATNIGERKPDSVSVLLNQCSIKHTGFDSSHIECQYVAVYSFSGMSESQLKSLAISKGWQRYSDKDYLWHDNYKNCQRLLKIEDSRVKVTCENYWYRPALFY